MKRKRKSQAANEAAELRTLSRRTRGNPPLVDAIQHGDRVTIRVPAGFGRSGQEWKDATGRAVMRSATGGWVLNMGGPHGRPGLADEENIVSVRKSRRNPRRELTVPEKHQLKIARDTLKMSDAMGVMGGPSKAEARKIIRRLSGKTRSNPAEQQKVRAYKLGLEAFAAGKKRIPALDPSLKNLLGRVGESSPILKAWLKGWDHGNLSKRNPALLPALVEGMGIGAGIFASEHGLSALSKSKSKRNPIPALLAALGEGGAFAAGESGLTHLIRRKSVKKKKKNKGHSRRKKAARAVRRILKEERRMGNPRRRDYCQMCGATRGLKIALDPRGERKTLCRLCRVGSKQLRESRRREARGKKRNPRRRRNADRLPPGIRNLGRSELMRFLSRSDRLGSDFRRSGFKLKDQPTWWLRMKYHELTGDPRAAGRGNPRRRRRVTHALAVGSRIIATGPKSGIEHGARLLRAAGVRPRIGKRV